MSKSKNLEVVEGFVNFIPSLFTEPSLASPPFSLRPSPNPRLLASVVAAASHTLNAFRLCRSRLVPLIIVISVIILSLSCGLSSVGANRVSIFMGSAIAVCSFFAFFVFFFMFFFINLGKEEEPSSRNLILAGTVIGLSLGSHLSTLKAKDSPMRLPAESFLTLRTFGAPAVVIVLAA
ncbi:hypothetical protein Sjap_022019 [Stephania japonica]|uniref:Uncharacterized protein n=1 Tax=Stephania japonica TaxID=461633 RepID=A0AAP0HTC1_9MAGN